MLNKRFKIAKCKTSLKLATSRIKLLRNKKGEQINQMKKELAQLLESGQDRTARIRVEHVIREEKMAAAYDLIEIYCELIVARLPVIESQKTCPIDLKEAISSVIFAAPRCSDIPELVDARKNFTAKYGKEFVTAAIEVRPDCGVNRMLIEKLSAVAPDVQTKVKVLTAVAKEHNINWNPTIFEDKESKPPDDLLNGSARLVQTSTIHPDSPKIQTSNVYYVQKHVENPNVPIDFSQQNRRFTLDARTSSTSTSRDDMRPSGMASGMMNTSQSFHRNSNGSSSFTDNWNTEFKDATHAAEAAAESAERASFAARAAAQLSSQGKITRQYSKSGDNESSSISEKADYYTEEVIKKQRSNNQLAAEHEVLTSGKKSVVNQGNRLRESTKTNTYGHSRRDDETDSDDDDHVFDSGFGYDEEEVGKSFFPSPGRETIRPFENPHIWSPKSVDPSVTSHLSDGPDSGSESETSFNGTNKFTSPRKHDTFSTKSSPKVNSTKSRSELNDNQSDDLDTGKDLNFGTLAGGLRNKGSVKYPPYKKSDNERLVKVEPTEPTSKQSSFNSRARRSENKKPSVSISSSDSDSDYYSKKKFPVQSPKTLSSFAPPNKFFNNNESDSEEEMAPVPKRTTSGKVGASSGMSLRTKGKTEMSKQSAPEQPPHTARFKKEPSETTPKPKVSEQPTVPWKKIAESSKSEIPKTPYLSPQTSLEGSKKPSHVHPNLPEYDSLAARIQSLQASSR